jgi:glycosyltransferase involved in cell wall biosynthesis
LRLAVVSPFLDREHGTELCVTEQIERLANQHQWFIELYSQRVSGLNGVRSGASPSKNPSARIVWHKVPSVPGPHLLQYSWWFVANHWRRWQDRRSKTVRPDLVYSPGINCLDADVIVVHIVFHAFYDRVRPELVLSRNPLRTWPRLIHRRLYYRLIMSLEKKIYRNSRTHLIAVSGLVAKQLKMYFRRDDSAIIPDAVDTFRFTPKARISQRNTSRRLFGYADQDFVLLFIGNDWKKKGLDTLLNALASLKDLPVRALVVGRDDPRIYRALVDQLGLNDTVRFEKPSSDVLSFYAAADLYTGPSLEDAFNLPIVEAMACGLPVIASTQTGASELIQDGESGFILKGPQDHQHLSELVRRIFTDQPLRGIIGGAASRQVLQECSWEKNVEETRKFLEAARHRPAHGSFCKGSL